MLHTADGKCTFLDSYDFSDEKETGQALAEVCEKSILLAKEGYDTNIYAVISNNAANMLKMGRLVDIWHCTCNSHTANLLAKDIVDANVMSKLVTVLKEFKHSDLEKRLVDSGGTRIMLPAETRWSTHRDIAKCLIRNLSAMKKIVADEKKV